MFMIFVINDFTKYYNSNDHHQAGEIFEFDKYLKGIGEESREFTGKFIKTQLFNQFIETYRSPDPSSVEHIKEFQETMQVFFDGGLRELKEAIDEKIRLTLKPRTFDISLDQAYRLYQSQLIDETLPE